MGEPAVAARSVSGAPHAGGQLAAALDRFFQSYYRLRPVNATFTGMHEYDHLLPDWSPDGLHAAQSEMRQLRTELVAARSGAPLDPTGPLAMDLDLADGFLAIQLAESESSHFQRGNPALFTGEAIFGIVGLLLRPFAPPGEQGDSAARRLDQLPTFFTAACSTLQRARIPPAWLERALVECRAGERLCSAGVLTWARQQGLTGALVRRLEAACRRAAQALTEFAAWLEARTPGGTGSCGAELFDLLLRRGHRESRDAGALLAAARDGFAAATERLDALAGAVDPRGWPGVVSALAQRHPPPEAYLSAFERAWLLCRAHAERHGLVTWPDYPIRYVPVPSWARSAAPDLYFLNYRSPAPHDAIPVVEYLVPPLDDANPGAGLAATNDSVIKLNHVVHHGAVGHHLQNHYAYRSPSRIGRIAAVDCASRIGVFSGGTMAEGWACYATDVMEETGFLSDLERVAQQHARVRQLARAIVDLELHTGSMTLEDAARLHVQSLGTAATAARREVTRTSMFPGTAIMYWLGTGAIHRLRADVARRDGAAFAVRRFHDALLAFGSVPVPLIAAAMLAHGDQ